MAHFSQTLCEELARTARSKEWEAHKGDELLLASRAQSFNNEIQRGASLSTGWTYHPEHHDWHRDLVALFMDQVRLTCAGRTLCIDPTGHPQTDDLNRLFLIPDKAICLLLKQRARELACEALSAVDVLSTLVMDD